MRGLLRQIIALYLAVFAVRQLHPAFPIFPMPKGEWGFAGINVMAPLLMNVFIWLGACAVIFAGTYLTTALLIRAVWPERPGRHSTDFPASE